MKKDRKKPKYILFVLGVILLTVLLVIQLMPRPEAPLPILLSIEEQELQKAREDVDADSYEALPGCYSKDKDQVFYCGRLVEGADPASFEVLGLYGTTNQHWYARDERNVYYNAEKVFGADPESFHVLPERKCWTPMCTNCMGKDENYRCFYRADALSRRR